MYPSVYALVTMELDTDEHIFRFWELNGLSGRKDIYELMGGVWVFTEQKESFAFPDNFPNTILLRILDVSDMTFAQLGKLLRRFMNNRFFYEYRPVKAVNDKHAYELYEEETIQNEETVERLKKDWLSLNWVYENAAASTISWAYPSLITVPRYAWNTQSSSLKTRINPFRRSLSASDITMKNISAAALKN